MELQKNFSEWKKSLNFRYNYNQKSNIQKDKSYQWTFVQLIIQSFCKLRKGLVMIMTKTKKRSRIHILASIIALTIVSSVSVSQFGYSSMIDGYATNSVDTSESESTYIDEDSAKAVALEDADVQENDVKYINVWIEYDNKIPQYYTVKFEVHQIKYKYEIDLYSGEILEKHEENQNENDSSEISEYISEDSAKAVVLEDADVQENDVKYINVWIEYDNKIPQYYTVKFEVHQIKYKYEIDLYSGEILEKHEENQNENDSSEISEYIGEDSAKAVALEDAGIQENDIKYINVWFEYDKGQPSCYVVKFGLRYEGNIRYKYEIDLYSGEILTKSTECCGDINDDGNVSVSDVVFLQKYILGSKSITKEKYEVADINTDGLVDVFDLVALKYKVLSK